MSLNEDMIRNHKVFARLTSAQSEDSTPNPKPLFSPEDSDKADNTDTVVPRVSRSEPEPQKLRAFSLARGEGAAQMPQAFAPPGSVSYPAGGGEAAAAAPRDPLETLYYQLEVESRRASQLIGEEGAYE